MGRNTASVRKKGSTKTARTKSTKKHTKVALASVQPAQTKAAIAVRRSVRKAGLHIVRMATTVKSKRMSGLNKGHLLMAAALVVVLLGVSAGAYSSWQNHQLRIAREVVSSAFAGISIESNAYNNDFLHGYVAYPITENSTLNTNVRSIADQHFMPCKNQGMRNRSPQPHECNVSFEITAATSDYIGFAYTVRTFTAHAGGRTYIQSLFFNRKTGEAIAADSLFTANAESLSMLSKVTRSALAAQLGDDFLSNAELHTAALAATEPHIVNFSNFTFGDNETVDFIFNNVAAKPIRVPVEASKLYGFLNQAMAQEFLPKIKQQKEAERRLAEEADAQRQYTRLLVAGNRSNINCATMKCIALTFDDGPHGEFTPRVLDALKARKAVATFFVLGSKVASHAAIVQRALNEYSEISNHTWSHVNLTHASSETLSHEVRQTEQAIFNVTGTYSRFMRPPYGAYNERVVAEVGLPLAMWSVDTSDWRDRNADIIYSRAVESAHPGGVILMHDIHSETVTAVPYIIDELQRQGYVLVTMSELFGVDATNVVQLSGKVFRQR